jgi:hypothetical protein
MLSSAIARKSAGASSRQPGLRSSLSVLANIRLSLLSPAALAPEGLQARDTKF